MIDTKGVRMNRQDDAARVESLRELSRLWTDFYARLTACGDALFQSYRRVAVYRWAGRRAHRSTWGCRRSTGAGTAPWTTG